MSNENYDKLEVEIEDNLFVKSQEKIVNGFLNEKIIKVKISIREKNFKDGRIMEIE